MTTKTTLLRSTTPFLVYAASIPILAVGGFGLSGIFAAASVFVAYAVLMVIAAAYFAVAGMFSVRMVDSDTARDNGLDEHDKITDAAMAEVIVISESIWHVPFLALLGTVMLIVLGSVSGIFVLLPAVVISVITWVESKANNPAA